MVCRTPEIMDEAGSGTALRRLQRTIAFNCRSFMNRHYTGIGRYAAGLINGLSAIDAHNRYILYASKGLFDRKRIIPRVKAANFLTKTDRFGRGLRRSVGKVDMYHALSPEIFDVEADKTIVTVHDLVYKAYPQGHTDETLRLTDEQFKFFVPKASRFICCSQSTANDLMKYCHVDASRIRVVFPGIDPGVFKRLEGQARQQAADRIKVLGITQPFILFIGTLEPRKNLKNLVEAFSQLRKRGTYDGRLVIAGMKGWKMDEVFGKGIADDIRGRIDLVGFLSDEDLCALYNLADCFAFPSHYEGFGFPIIEALSCAVPVLTSHTSSCQEVAGGCALCVDPNDPKEMADGLERLIHDAPLRQNLIERGLHHVRNFTRAECARKTLNVYQELYED